MGEVADWLIERMLEGPDPDFGDYEPIKATCNRCGTAGLIWGVDKGRWALFASRTLERHTCPQAAPEEFPTV